MGEVGVGIFDFFNPFIRNKFLFLLRQSYLC